MKCTSFAKSQPGGIIPRLSTMLPERFAAGFKDVFFFLVTVSKRPSYAHYSSEYSILRHAGWTQDSRSAVLFNLCTWLVAVRPKTTEFTHSPFGCSFNLQQSMNYNIILFILQMLFDSTDSVCTNWTRFKQTIRCFFGIKCFIFYFKNLTDTLVIYRIFTIHSHTEMRSKS